jgi:hypothetical protein
VGQVGALQRVDKPLGRAETESREQYPSILPTLVTSLCPLQRPWWPKPRDYSASSPIPPASRCPHTRGRRVRAPSCRKRYSSLRQTACAAIRAFVHRFPQSQPKSPGGPLSASITAQRKRMLRKSDNGIRRDAGHRSSRKSAGTSRPASCWAIVA